MNRYGTDFPTRPTEPHSWPDEVQASQEEGEKAVGEGDEAELVSAESEDDQDAEERPEDEGGQRDGESHQHELAERVLGGDQKPDLQGEARISFLSSLFEFYNHVISIPVLLS